MIHAVLTLSKLVIKPLILSLQYLLYNHNMWSYIDSPFSISYKCTQYGFVAGHDGSSKAEVIENSLLNPPWKTLTIQRFKMHPAFMSDVYIDVSWAFRHHWQYQESLCPNTVRIAWQQLSACSHKFSMVVEPYHLDKACSATSSKFLYHTHHTLSIYELT